MSVFSSLTNRIFVGSAILVVAAIGLAIYTLNVSVTRQAEADLRAGLAEAATLVDELSLDLELETGVCHFNGVAYAVGQYVRSGSELLHCEERGVWVRKGEMRPDDAA